MKVYWNMIQGSEEWHKYRYRRVGGTGVKSIMGSKGASALIDDILSAWCEDFQHEEGYTSDDMQRGLDLEPIARQDVSAHFGKEFKEAGVIQSDLPILYVSPDGITEDLTEATEIKCPSRIVHQRYIRENKIPTEYFWQCMNYFAVNPKLQKLHFVSYRPEHRIPMFIKTITRDEVIHFKKKQTVDEFANEIRLVAQQLQGLAVKELTRLADDEFITFDSTVQKFIGAC